MLTKEEAEVIFAENGFNVTRIDNSGCMGTYYFRMWTAHQNGFGINIMQNVGKDVIDVHITKDAGLVSVNESPFNGGPKAYLASSELDVLLKQVADGKFTQRPMQFQW